MQHKFDIGDIVTSRSVHDDSKYFLRIISKNYYNSRFGHLVEDTYNTVPKEFTFVPSYGVVRLDNFNLKRKFYRNETLLRSTERSYAGDF